MPKSILIIPTYNGGEKFWLLLESLERQTYQPDHRLVIDSSSADQTVELARLQGFEVSSITPAEFNHGATRQWGVERFPGFEIVIFLTQDAILAEADSLQKLVECFSDPKVGAAYGRQLPHQGAGVIGAHARLFNYPEESRVKSIGDAPKLGIKTAFCSNSFAAYRRVALMGVGGFPSRVIFGEDMYVAAKMLLAGWQIFYCAGAKVYHSHDYGYLQEFRRYFDIGVFHAREAWLIEKFGHASGEGKEFLFSEIKYVGRRHFFLLFSVFWRTALKLTGYQLGLKERYLPRALKAKLSMQGKFWNEKTKE